MNIFARVHKVCLLQFALYALLVTNAHTSKLLSDGQIVIITITEGELKGQYFHTYRQAKKQFGPTRVLHHDATSLTFRGRRDTCKITIDGKVRCNEIGGGSWKLK